MEVGQVDHRLLDGCCEPHVLRHRHLPAGDCMAVRGIQTMRKFKGDKCPTCGTEFIEDMCPTQVARRKREKAKRSRAAKKGWKTRGTENFVRHLGCSETVPQN